MPRIIAAEQFVLQAHRTKKQPHARTSHAHFKSLFASKSHKCAHVFVCEFNFATHSLITRNSFKTQNLRLINKRGLKS